MRTIVFERTPECLVAVRGREALNDTEWAEYARAIDQMIREGLAPRCLVVSHGGSPTPAQRRDLAERFAPLRDRMKVAILTGSTYVRGVVSALSAEQPGFRVFELDQVDQAIEYLGVRPTGAVQVKLALDRLTRELS